MVLNRSTNNRLWVLYLGFVILQCLILVTNEVVSEETLSSKKSKKKSFQVLTFESPKVIQGPILYDTTEDYSIDLDVAAPFLISSMISDEGDYSLVGRVSLKKKQKK